MNYMRVFVWYRYSMLLNAVSIVNGKGGVGKTTLTANLAALLAAAGWRVLAVDADPQGNLGVDLGYRNSSGDDSGASLARVLAGGRPIIGDDLLVNAREGLAVLPGGEKVDHSLIEHSSADRLSEGLAAVASEHNIVLIDCPPEIGSITRLAMSASHGLVVPVLPDDASILGLEPVARQVAELRNGPNPDLVLLGVVIMQIPTSASRLLSDTRSQIEDSGLPVFASTIRFTRRAAADCRRRGITAHEYAKIAAPEIEQRFQMLRRGEKPTVSTAAGGLAADYSSLAVEVANSVTQLTGPS